MNSDNETIEITKENQKVVIATSISNKQITIQVSELNNGKIITANEPLVVYPNPSRDVVFIKLDKFNIDNADIQIIDSKGSTVENVSCTFNSRIFKINTKNLTPGIYIVRIRTNTKTAWAKFVKSL